MKFVTPVITDLNNMPPRFPQEFEDYSVRGVSYGDNNIEHLNSDNEIWRKEMPEWDILFKMLADQMFKEGFVLTSWRLWDACNVPFTEKGGTEGCFGFENWTNVEINEQLKDEKFEVAIDVEDGNWVMTVVALNKNEEWVGQECDSIRDIIALWDYEFED